jgi:hypothetical protein
MGTATGRLATPEKPLYLNMLERIRQVFFSYGSRRDGVYHLFIDKLGNRNID